jgi:hypothetical protein
VLRHDVATTDLYPRELDRSQVMSMTTMRAKIVRIRIEDDEGLFVASSPDLKGLLVAARELDVLEREIPRMITELYAACGEEVVVSKADDSGDDACPPWIAFPAAVARQALDCPRRN